MMTDNREDCGRKCWMMAAAAGVVLAILLMIVTGLGWFSSLLLGGLVFVICGFVFPMLFCANAAPVAAPEAPAPSPAPEPTKATATATPAPKPSSAPAAPATPAKTPPAAPAPVDVAPADGAKPEGLNAARGGAPDDLKHIKGVGPKLEQLLNGMGFYHFDQIAAWSAKEVAWVDDNLEGFKGRVTRDDWVAQAKTLAAGGETEFSKRSKGKKK